MAAQIRHSSWERIRDELLQILAGADPARGLELLQKSGLLAVILPEVEAMKGVEQPREYHPEGDVFVHTRMALGFLRKPSPVLALGTLLHDVGKPATFKVKERIRFDGHVEVGIRMAEAICRRLRMRVSDIDAVVDLVRHHLRFTHVRQMRESTLRRFLRKPNFADHLELHRADCLSSHRRLDNYLFCRKKLREYRKGSEFPRPLLRGRDLIALGYQPGPLFADILRAVEDLQLEKALQTHEDAVNFVLERYPKNIQQES
jgi:poly(A) polymerase